MGKEVFCIEIECSDYGHSEGMVNGCMIGTNGY